MLLGDGKQEIFEFVGLCFVLFCTLTISLLLRPIMVRTMLTFRELQSTLSASSLRMLVGCEGGEVSISIVRRRSSSSLPISSPIKKGSLLLIRVVVCRGMLEAASAVLSELVSSLLGCLTVSG